MEKVNNVLKVLLTLSIFVSCNSKKIHEKVPHKIIIKIKGSDTEFEMVKALCAQFKSSDSLDYSIEGGGTQTGIMALINDEIDMATASREITTNESCMLEKQSISVLPIMFATDAVAIITHPHLGVHSLTLNQLSKIYKGEINNWKKVGGPNREITLYTRDKNSGTFVYFKNKVTHGEININAKVCRTTNEIMEYVMIDSSSIGYVGAGFLMDKNGKPSGKVWAMPLRLDNKQTSYSPYEVNEVAAGNYPLTRPLYQYYKLPVKNKVKDFILFELSLRGQAIIKQSGYFPISDYQKEINKLNGFDL
ncbi:MAG: phosphate ABC transporter substrate-binding protein [Bacteroidetes bacterium]|nr:phosphate ABC transporter substrate-binding protein [Bacteroidota bacterium]